MTPAMRRTTWVVARLCVLLVGMSHATVSVAAVRRSSDAENGADGVVRGGELPFWKRNAVSKSAMLAGAGGLAAAVAKTATAPLERAKLLAQAGNPGSFGELMQNVVRVEGWGGLWRGNPANLWRVVPNKGILLMCSDVYKGALASVLPACSAPVLSTCAGSLAGFTSVLVTYPLELVRTRMAFRFCVDEQCELYASVGRTLRNIVRSDGAAGLYNGVGATLVGALPFEGLKFGAYEYLKERLPRGDDGKPLPICTVIAGATAGALAHAVTHPLDTVRRRMQISGAAGSAVAYKNMFDCVRVMVATEGAASLYKGISATVVRSIPNLGIQFLVYELVKSMLGFS